MHCFKLLVLFVVSLALPTTSSAWLVITLPTRQGPQDCYASLTSLEARKQNTPRPDGLNHNRRQNIQQQPQQHATVEEEEKFIAGTATSRLRSPALPMSTKRVQISIPRTGGGTSSHQYPLPIQVYQVNDRNWWEGVDEVDADSNDTNNSKNNRYGGRCWPSSLAVAEFLVNHLLSVEIQNSNNNNKTTIILELACGPGIPSLAVAAYCRHAQVTATDSSPVALGLLRDGWKATSNKILLKQRKMMTIQQDDDESSTLLTPPLAIGSLSVQLFDIFSNDPLPLPTLEGTTTTTTIAQPIVLGCSVLYDAKLAKGMARRFVEACREHNAWVIVGDDDTGERDGGRKVFLDELQRLENQGEDQRGMPRSIPRVWTHSKVQNEALGWRDKTAHLLHLNPPPSLLELLNSESHNHKKEWEQQ